MVEGPQPQIGPTEVLVRTTRSLVSSGTERAVRELASAGLLQKAKARPDLVKQVIQRALTEGPRATASAVQAKLSDEMPLGYSGAGIVEEVGEHVDARVRPGMRVATASAGHGSMQVVPGLLAVPVPEGVTDASAAFGAVGAIALQGLRRADLQAGSVVLVVGLGLVGQLTARMALASGFRVLGVDVRQANVDLAREHGVEAFAEAGEDTTQRILALTEGRGVDSVLVTAATKSSDPMLHAANRAMDGGSIVVVGDVGLDLDRRPLYEKEIDVRFARSYGPGRYVRSYEDFGVDMPAGQVRWTEGRNIEAFLQFLEQGMVVEDLVTHVFDLEDSDAAYGYFAENPRTIAVQFEYPAEAGNQAGETGTAAASGVPFTVELISDRGDGYALVGAGNYAQRTFLPALAKAGWGEPTVVSSRHGTSAKRLAANHDGAEAEVGLEAVIRRRDVGDVFLLSSHADHGTQSADALRAGCNVFVEKPLAITQDELTGVQQALEASPGHLSVGFNRRFSPSVVAVREAFAEKAGPLVMTYVVAAGSVGPDHWYHDRRQGGRMLGEVCHFVDVLSWIHGSHPVAVSVQADGLGESGTVQENYAVTVRYHDGSLGTVTYAEGSYPGATKEQLHVHGRGSTVLMRDFGDVSINGQRIKKLSGGKGHVEQLVEWRKVTREGQRPDPRHLQCTLGSTATMLAAMRSLTTGKVQEPDLPRFATEERPTQR
ncbi:hypothetical protein BJF82_03290 [Kytococcus sp. CUA-901]|nr:hypothetical protein BJF82_03290 [Kytococcus sp. CUA-901]